MASNNHGGTTRTRANGSRNSESGSSRGGSNRSKSQDSSGGFLNAVRQRPLTSAAIAAGAAGAGAFLWARRAQLSDQISSFGDSINERFSSSADSGEPTSMDVASETKTQRTMSSGSKPSKTSRSSMDPTFAEQKAGVIAY